MPANIFIIPEIRPVVSEGGFKLIPLNSCSRIETDTVFYHGCLGHCLEFIILITGLKSENFLFGIKSSATTK